MGRFTSSELGYYRGSESPVWRDDTNFASGKIAVLQYVTMAVFLYLISGFWVLQVRDPEYYSEQADRNRIKALPILAPRGKILDREGRVVVDNHASFTLILSRESLREANVRPIAEGLNLDYEHLRQRLARFRTRARYEPIIVKDELTAGELAFVEAHRDPDTFPEMELIPSHRRLYPRDGGAAHLIGYVGEISEGELNSAEFARYEQGDVIGKAGLERQYNAILMGTDGQRRVVVDNRGRHREVIAMKPSVSGRNLQTTLDLDLQVVAELTLESRRGAIVALDPRNGEVLALASTPTYDPNKFAGRIRPDDWRLLLNNPDIPLLNRAIQAQLAPGSTFKPIVALAALEAGVIDDNFQVYCNGGASFHGRYFKCHLKGGHGLVNLHKGLAQSCDVFFYNLGNRLGIDTLAHYAQEAGLGRKTGIDLPSEAEGVVPSSEWKMRNFRLKWYAGETISVAIGQGALTATPLQLAYAIGGLSMGGVWHRPHLVRDPGRQEPPRIAEINPANAAKVVAGLYAAVNEGGTGVRAQIPGISVCGKTGTSQLASNDYLRASKLGQSLKDNAWFVGFAPCESPEIVVAALWESGEHGNLAAPLVRDVIKAYFDKKARPRRGLTVAEARQALPQLGPVQP